MLLAIDIGNTRIKYAVFEKSQLIWSEASKHETWNKNIEELFIRYPLITDSIISSVGNMPKDWLVPITSRVRVVFVDHQSDFPFINDYSTPHTLGIDRMILASGATLRYPRLARLVIDAGTAITYDFIDSNDHYLGGAISPGLRLRYQALHNYTAKLPLLELTDDKIYIGDSTQASIHSGVINGVIYEIEGFINQVRQTHQNFIIILTGGNTDFLAKRLKSTIFANRNFLLESLNDLFQYQNR